MGSYRFGITENGDAGIDLSWVDKLEFVNIIISKYVIRRNKAFMKALLENKSKIILHIVCSGLGSNFEKVVPEVDEVKKSVKFLIDNGFPISHMVLRVSPIIPISGGIKSVERVLEAFKDVGIKRCRYSILDIDSDLCTKFSMSFGGYPYKGFPMFYMLEDLENLLLKYSDVYEFEACKRTVNNSMNFTGCISFKDLDILGYSDITSVDIDFDLVKSNCSCLYPKVELLSDKGCPGGCIYCKRGGEFE